MATATFDTLKFANTLKAAGVPDKQAEAQASVLGEALAVNFKERVTKDDLTATMASLRTELQNDLRQTERRLNAKSDDPFAKLDRQFTQLKWMAGVLLSLNVAVLIRVFLVRVP